MKRTTLKTRLWALAATLLLLISLLAMPVSAVKGGTTTFNKYLILNENAHVPDADFTFKIAPGTPVPADSASGMPAIYAGIGAPTVSVAAFSPDDTATTKVENNEVTLETGEAYAKKQVTVDFSSVDFTAPGIYRYTITENDPTSQSGVEIEGNSTRTLDVYVEYTDDSATNLAVTHYVLQDGTDNPNSATKSKGFTNTYTTYDLTLTKKVTGNQGDRDKFFRFTVEISNAVPGTVYDVVIPTTDTPQQDDLEQGDNLSSVNSNRLTVGAAESPSTTGSVTGTYYLKSGQSIVIQGLTKDTKYTIEEKSYSTDGYSTAYSVEVGGKEVVQSTTSNSTGDRKMSIDATEPDGTATTGDNTVTFTNSKSGTVPTGILLETAPYLILGAVVVVGLVVLFATRRRRTRE